MIVEPVQLILIIPKSVESLLFLLNILLVYRQYKEYNYPIKPQIYKLLMIGMLGWFIYITLDIFVYIIAPMSMQNVTPPAFISGYDFRYPSLIIADVMRDIGFLGGMIILWAYFILPFSILWGPSRTTKIFWKNKIPVFFFTIISIIFAWYDKIGVYVTNSGVTVKAVLTGISGYILEIFTIIYFFSTILLLLSYQESINHPHHEKYPLVMKYLIIGVMLMGMGNLYWIIIGSSPIFKALFSQSTAIYITFMIVGYLIWTCSPIFLRLALRNPIIAPIKDEDIINFGLKNFQRYVNDELLSMYILKNNRILFANQCMANVINYPINEINNWSFEDFSQRIHPDDRDIFYKMHYMSKLKLFESKKKVLWQDDKDNNSSAVLRILHNNDNNNSESGVIFKWIRLYTNKFKIQNEDLIQGCFIDITVQKNLEEQITSNEMQNQKIETISLLAGGIAHDFNNYLVAILGNINLLQFMSTDNPDYTATLDNLEKGTLRAKDLTQQLLSFSKGGAPLKNPSYIIDIIKESAKFVLSGSKSKIEYYLDEKVAPMNLDAGQISQVLNNLLVNADQSMLEGGIIQVYGRNMFLDQDNEFGLKKGAYYEIEIKDQGCGIPKKNFQNVFELYYTTKLKNTGLGLPFSQNIIKRHDGIITFKSEEGVGTSFFIYLPIPENLKIKNINKPHQEDKFSGNILIMDDDAAVLKTLKSMLEIIGFKVSLTSNGSELLEKYKRSQEEGEVFELIILDLIIPGLMGGKDCANELHKLDPKIKMIVTSGYSEDPIMANYLDYHFKGVLSKPYTMDELKSAISNVLNK